MLQLRMIVLEHDKLVGQIVILTLFYLALGLFWIGFELKQELPQNGFVMTFDQSYPVDISKKVSASNYSDILHDDPRVIYWTTTYDTTFEDLNIRMFQGDIAYQMNLPLLAGQSNFTLADQVILSREEAMKTFGKIECVGNIYSLFEKNWIVVGVFDVGKNSGNLSWTYRVGEFFNQISVMPQNFVLGKWGLGVNDQPNGYKPKLSSGANELVSPNMTDSEKQLDVWLSYEAELLDVFPWQMSQWVRSSKPVEDALRLKHQLSLINVNVVDVKVHHTLIELYQELSEVFFVTGILGLLIYIELLR